MMKVVAKPRVFISYTWRPEEMKRQVLDLSERLRASRMDCRIDQYYQDAHFGYGFVPPEKRPGDTLKPWIMWAEDQIQSADFVLLVCSREYGQSIQELEGGSLLFWSDWRSIATDLKSGRQSPKDLRVPYMWWDWYFMAQELESGRAEPQKFIPVGFGPYTSNSQYVPSFIKGANYYNLDSSKDFEGLLRRIQKQFRQRHPREGVFISYAHSDQRWLTLLRRYLVSLKDSGVDIWVDREEIDPGERWHEEIQDALATVRVAVLLVTPAFLASPYVRNHELPTLLSAAESDGLVIFWIPVESSNYKEYKFKDIQAAHDPAKPLFGLKGDRRGQALVDIVDKLKRILGVGEPSEP